MARGVKFAGDSSSLTKAATEAASSVAKVAATAEEARQRIVTSYEAQVKAATKAGESQKQLAAITRQYTAVIANVTEDSAQRSINAVDRIEARILKYRNAAASLAITEPQSQFNFGGTLGTGSLQSEVQAAQDLEHAIDGVSAAHSRGVSPMVQFGSVLRGAEGNFTRNVRAAEAFGSTLSFLGPVVEKAFPVVGALTLGYALLEMGKRAYEAFQNVVNLRGAIEGLNNLKIDTDKDAQRDRDAVESSIEAILGKTQGQAAALGQKYGYQSTKAVDLSSFFYNDAFKKLPDDVKGNFEATYKSIAPADLPARLQQITSTVNGLKAAIAGVKDGSISAFNLPSFAGARPNATRNPQAYYEAQLAAAQQIQSRLSGATDVRTAGLQQIQIEQSAAAKEAASKAAQQAQQEQQKNLSLQRQLWNDELVEWQASGARTNAEIAQWWATKAVVEAAGSANFREALRHANEETVKTISDTTRREETYRKELADLSKDQSEGIAAGPDLSQADEAAKSYSQWSQNVNANRIALQQNADTLEQVTIQTRLSNGEITRQQAAQQIAALHAREYAAALAEINAQQEALDNNDHLTDAQRKAAQSSIDLQKTQLGGKEAVTDVQDQAAIAASSWSGQFKQANKQWIDDLNGQLANVITGQKTSWASLFSSIGSQIAKIGLSRLESSIFGGGDDSGSGSGGFLGSIGKFFTGRAVGGNVDANGTYVVGERGPEILRLGPQSGRITPNNQLGGEQHNWMVDARGASDPAAVEAAVNRAFNARVPGLLAGAVSATYEHGRRLPTNVRRS